MAEEKKRKDKEEVVVPPMYKLNMYLPNGLVRHEINSAITYHLARNWGDIIRCIPSTRWCTIDEIVQLVWEFEKKNYLRTGDRTRKQIEDCIQDLIDGGAILTK